MALELEGDLTGLGSLPVRSLSLVLQASPLPFHVPGQLGIGYLQQLYKSGQLTPSQLIDRLFPLLESEPGVFITLASVEQLHRMCR